MDNAENNPQHRHRFRWACVCPVCEEVKSQALMIVGDEYDEPNEESMGTAKFIAKVMAKPIAEFDKRGGLSDTGSDSDEGNGLPPMIWSSDEEKEEEAAQPPLLATTPTATVPARPDLHHDKDPLWSFEQRRKRCQTPAPDADTCWGCRTGEPNQQAHMDVGGCLYQDPRYASEEDDEEQMAQERWPPTDVTVEVLPPIILPAEQKTDQARKDFEAGQLFAASALGDQPFVVDLPAGSTQGDLKRWNKDVIKSEIHKFPDVGTFCHDCGYEFEYKEQAVNYLYFTPNDANKANVGWVCATGCGNY